MVTEGVSSRFTVMAAALTVLTGCSYAFVRGPSASTPPLSDPAAEAKAVSEVCTRSNALPILDTVLGTVLATTGVVAMVAGIGTLAEHKQPCQDIGCFTISSGDAAAVTALGAAAAAGGGVLLGSGISGFGRTEDRRRAIAASTPRMLPPAAIAPPSAPASP